jgi:hypothetical protein
LNPGGKEAIRDNRCVGIGDFAARQLIARAKNYSPFNHKISN